MEFEDKEHRLLTAEKKRFVDRDKLNARDEETLTDEQAELVYKSMRDFFDNRPYKKWFNPLDDIMQAFGASFYNGTLINLDLAPWATYRKWGKLTESERDKLIGEFSVKNILTKGFNGLYINGRALE